MKKVYVTGSNGFVGKSLIEELKKRKINYISGDRSSYGNLESQTNWEAILSGCDIVIHLAARVHVMDEKSTDPLETFRKVNVEGSVNLAKAAKALGVKRFIFISSIKVNGEETDKKPFTAQDLPNPKDAYGLSKAEAEKELLKLHSPGVFEVVIVRPPLVYGPGVKANFEKLFLLVKKNLPLPFGMINNKRSLVSVFNLCDFIIQCANHPKASGEIFLISDGRDYSLRDLILLIGKVTGKHPFLLSVPISFMQFCLMILGKKSFSNRLFGNLHVDITKAQMLIGWKPQYDFEQTFKT